MGSALKELKNLVRKATVFFCFLLLTSCCILQVQATNAEWLSEYENRMLFYWQSSASGQDSFTVYNQTGINHDSKFYIFNETQSDFEDLRVTLADGITLLPLWNQTTIEQTSVKVWCNFPTANASYYLYWNNPNETTHWANNVFNAIISGATGVWLMNEPSASDSIMDYSGNNNNGVPTDTSIETGKFEGTTARGFDGTGAHISLNALPNLNEWTVTTWFKRSGSSSAANPSHMLFCGLNQAWNNGLYVFDAGTLAVGAYQQADFTFKNAVVGVSNPDVFNFYTYLCDGSNIAVGFNNVFDSNVSVTAPIDYNQAASIGWLNTDYYYTNGVISGLYLFNYALTSEELTAFYNGYGDPTIETGKVYVRTWITGNTVNLFGEIESDSLLVEDAIGLAVVFGVVAIALAVVFAAKRNS